MDALKRLEQWQKEHKARSVNITHEDGYGASAWSVELFNGRQSVACCDFLDMPDENNGNGYRIYTEQELVDDITIRVSLEEVINEAINRAEKKWN